MDFWVSASTDVGIKKQINQDSLFARRFESPNGTMAFAVLCDGMGGLAYGELASSLLVSAFSDWMYEQLPAIFGDRIQDHVIRKQWTDLIAVKNSWLHAYGLQNQCRVGTTVTALLLTQSRYYLLNIGDSRAYEIGRQVIQMTQDHTLVAEEIRLGNLTPEQAEQSPIRNVLSRCVGVMDTVQPDLFFGDVRPGAAYVLCSDGFRHKITEKELKQYLLADIMSEQEMKQQEEYLIDLNKYRGETDNISVITIRAIGEGTETWIG